MSTPQRRTLQTVTAFIAPAAGTVASLSFHPIGWIWAMPALLLLLFYYLWNVTQARIAFGVVLAFTFSLFIAGLWWVFSALSGHVGLPVGGALLLTILFCLVLALFPATALAIAILLSKPGGFSRLIMLAACWTLAEWLRGHMFTGFPWLSLGYSQIPSAWFAAWAPITGIFGVTLALTLTLASAIALVRLRRRRLAALLMLAVTVGTPTLVNNTWQWITPAGTITVSLLQGNVKQSLKWEAGAVERALDDYQRLASTSEGRIIIMPETALPMLIDDLPDGYIDRLRSVADNRIGAVIAGVFDEDENGIYNAAVALEKNSTALYRKVHLTPYGEYLPFADTLKPLLGAAGIPYSGLSAGTEAKPLRLPDGILTAISICYEDIFGDEWRRQLPAAHFLTNITNDAWFDETIMPHQHMRMAQARALETGRWLVRATNTGITAIVDENGRIVARLPSKINGVLTEEITLFRGATPYVHLGDAAAALIALLLILSSVWLNFHHHTPAKKKEKEDSVEEKNATGEEAAEKSEAEESAEQAPTSKHEISKDNQPM